MTKIAKTLKKKPMKTWSLPKRDEAALGESELLDEEGSVAVGAAVVVPVFVEEPLPPLPRVAAVGVIAAEEAGEALPVAEEDD